MQYIIHPQRLARSPRARLLAAATILVSGLLAAACGGTSSSPSAAAIGGAPTSAPSTASASSTGSRSDPPPALAFAKCMRSNGVPSFPDPQGGGSFVFHASPGIISSPAFRAAQAKCRKLMPPIAAGPGANSFPPQEKAQAMERLRKVAQCMRQHGISAFPDPTTTRPANLSPGEYSTITDYDGAFLLLPATIDMQSPAWKQAAAACGSLAESFDHAHH